MNYAKYEHKIETLRNQLGQESFGHEPLTNDATTIAASYFLPAQDEFETKILRYNEKSLLARMMRMRLMMMKSHFLKRCSLSERLKKYIKCLNFTYSTCLILSYYSQNVSSIREHFEKILLGHDTPI